MEKNKYFMFNDENSIALRRLIINEASNGKIKYYYGEKYTKSYYCVINPIDYCRLSCEHCLYSTKNINKESCDKIDINKTNKITKFLCEAGVRQIVFSGGGEPFENLNVVLKIAHDVSELEEAIIITSGYFAEKKDETEKILKSIVKLCNIKRKSGKKHFRVILRISRDRRYTKRVSDVAIKNILDFVLSPDKNEGGSIKIIFRTIFDPEDEIDIALSKIANMEIRPTVELNDIKNIPQFDGVFTRWLVDKKIKQEIPIIYKPMYYVGKSKKFEKISQNTVWDLISIEEDTEYGFNLCIRGDRGQGHNYYEDILKGYEKWISGGRKLINKYDSQIIKKELALYITARSEITINNGVLDNYIYADEIISWNDFLKKQYDDILQRILISKGSCYLLKIVSEIDSQIENKITDNNFVFSVNYLCTETPQKRLYCTLRLLEDGVKEEKIEICNQNLRKLILKGAGFFRECYKLYEKNSTNNIEKLQILDPIKGAEKSVVSQLFINESANTIDEILGYIE